MHPQILILLVFKIANLSQYWLQIKFYLFTFAINLWHWKFITADVTAVFVNNQHGSKWRGQDFDKKFVFEGVHSKEVDKRIFEQSWTKRGVNKLFKKLQDIGIVNRRPGSGRPRSARIEKNAKLLLQKFPQSATDFVLLIVRWSDREHLFVHKENKVSGILWELLKQKLSTLHVSSAVRVCQLLCTAPIERFQMHVLTNNPRHRLPMNSHLLWYLTDSPVGLRLVLLTQD